MSGELVKIKPKKDYDWHQDSKYVYIRLPLPNTSKDKIHIYLSDLVLRVTWAEKRATHFFDLYDKVDYHNKNHKSTYAGGVLEIILTKETEGMWPALLAELPMNELKERRKESDRRYEATTQEIEEKKEKLRDEFDRKATQQLMRFEQEERDKLETRKKEQKEQALNQVYKDIDFEGKITQNNVQSRQQKSVSNWDDKERLALEFLQREEKQEQEKREEARRLAKVAAVRSTVVSKNSLFSAEQVEASELAAIKNSEKYEEIPVRKAENVALKFTEKLYPNVATRQTHYLDPPVPSNKQANKGDKAEALEDRNPLWLKDKGDKFASNKDFVSAISAYDRSLKLDDKLLPALLNRSYCNMRMFNFDQCLQDCESALLLLKGMIGGIEEPHHNKKTAAKIHLRKAICQAWKGDIDTAKDTFKKTKENYREILSQEDINEIDASVKAIELRQESNRKKQQADFEFKRGNLEHSSTLYSESASIDNNQYCYANNALVLLKLNRSKDVIEEADKALQRINLLTEHSQMNSNSAASSFQASNLLIKVLLRKASAQKQLGHFADSLETIRSALALQIDDRECKALQKELEVELNRESVKKLKDEAAALLKESKFEAALDRYNQCLKLLEASEVLEYLAILQNRCVCYLKLQRWDDIVSTAIRSLKIIHNQQNRLVSFDNTKVDRQQKEKLKEYEVRILVRRANAYLNLGQIYNAKGDLEKALQLSPENVSIKSELERVEQALQAKK